MRITQNQYLTYQLKVLIGENSIQKNLLIHIDKKVEIDFLISLISDGLTI